MSFRVSSFDFSMGKPPWLPAVAALLLIWPLNRHARRQFIKVTIEGEKLRYETGWLAKSTRIIQLPKVQDVRVNQTVMQRIFGVGDVAIETAGGETPSQCASVAEMTVCPSLSASRTALR